MKLIVAGGRNYVFTDSNFDDLEALCNTFSVTEIITGGASGADYWGKLFAEEMGIHNHEMPAQWDVFGPAAGPIRNKYMAKRADAVVLFPGGKGTASMLKEASLAEIKVFDWRHRT